MIISMLLFSAIEIADSIVEQTRRSSQTVLQVESVLPARVSHLHVRDSQSSQ